MFCECGLASPEVFAALVNGVPMDLASTLAENVSLEPVSFSSADGKEIYRHSSTHIMAQAVKDVFPSVNVTICLLYTSPSPRDLSTSRMPSSA